MEMGKFITNGNPWNHPYKAANVLCGDGKRRTVRLNQEADSWFSWPGRCTIKGKTIRGYVTGYENNGERDLQFRHYDESAEFMGGKSTELFKD